MNFTSLVTLTALSVVGMESSNLHSLGSVLNQGKSITCFATKDNIDFSSCFTHGGLEAISEISSGHELLAVTGGKGEDRFFPKRTYLWNGSPIPDADIITPDVSSDGLVTIPILRDGKPTLNWKLEGQDTFSVSQASKAAALNIRTSDANSMVICSSTSGIGRLDSKYIVLTPAMKMFKMKIAGNGGMSSTYAALYVNGDRNVYSKQAPSNSTVFDEFSVNLQHLRESPNYRDNLNEIVIRVSLIDGGTSEAIGVGESLVFASAAKITKVGLFKNISANMQNRVAFYAEDAKTKFNAPGVWMSVWVNGEVKASYASGKLNIEKSYGTSLEDSLPYGSISKALTGTLAAVLINRGVIDWSTKASDILPELYRANYPSSVCLNATVQQLIEHRSGLANGPYDAVSGTSPSSIRYNFVKKILSKEPVGTIGGRSSYAPGVEVVALMLEKITGQPLEQLFQKYLFYPCGVGDKVALGDPFCFDKNAKAPIGYSESPSGYKILDGEKPSGWLPGLRCASGAVYGTIDGLSQILGTCSSTNADALFGRGFTENLMSVSQGSFHTRTGWVKEGNVLYHTGGNGRGQSAVILDIKAKVCVSFVMNQCDGKYYPSYLDYMKKVVTDLSKFR